MLDAFRIEQSARNVLLVQAAESLATLVPISPGGIGTQQALLVYTLRGKASRSALLAFSVGMKLTLTVVNVVLGFAAILLTLRTLRFRGLPARLPRRDSLLSELTSPALRCGAAGRRPRAPSSPAVPERPRAPPARRRGSGRPNRSGAGSPACATGPMPSSVSKIDSNARVSRRLPVKRDREPVRLVADALQQLEPRVVPIEQDRLRAAGNEHLLLPFRERDDGDARQARRRLDRLERRRQLPLAAVDHDEVRHCREALVVAARLGAVAQAREPTRDRPDPSRRSRPGRRGPRTVNER